VPTVQGETGELLTDRPGLRIVLLAETEDLSASYAVTGAGGPFPPPHVHREHADCFLVLDGAVGFRLGEAEHAVEAESWVQVPRGIVHTFAPAGDAPATFVNVHAPSRGYGSFARGLATAKSEEDLRRVREAFDQFPPPADGGRDPAAAAVRRLGGEGEAITERPGRRVTLLADTEELGVTESVYGPGEQGPEPHVHREHTDAWLVLEGELTFALDGGRGLRAGAGTLVVVPPLVTHSFWNEGETAARFVNLHAPSRGFGDYLRGRNPGFDQHDPPAAGGADPAAVLVRRLP
jgi:mannose-6-phosphate isomerase-like protein (cupin superfamily)